MNVEDMGLYPVECLRFRSYDNVVITKIEPINEDDPRRVNIGDTIYHYVVWFNGGEGFNSSVLRHKSGKFWEFNDLSEDVIVDEVKYEIMRLLNGK
jgi:hypothetical protein